MLLLASHDDVAVRLGRLLTADESQRVEPLLEEASVMVGAWIGGEPDPVPDGVRVVVSRMVARVFTAASNTSAPEAGVASVSMTAGPFGFTRGFTTDASSGGVWLGQQDKAMLKPHRRGGGAVSVPTC